MKVPSSLSLRPNLKGIGSRTGKALMSMDFLNQSADEGFSIQLNPMLGFDLRDNFGDVKGPLGSTEYVYGHIHIRHPLSICPLGLLGSGGLELPNGTELG
jgi:hypothetical protein